MGLFSQLKKFDVYRDVPKDLTEQTVIGAIVSLLCGIIVVYLFCSEFLAFLTIETTSEMYVDPDIDHHNHATIMIRMNFTVPRMPCAVTSVDVQDVMGSHIVDYGGKLHRWRTDETGQLKFGLNGLPLSHESIDPEGQIGEGCNVEGSLIVKMVPGNFHVSAHAHGDLITLFYPRFPIDTLNCTHYVHQLIFGETDALEQLGEAAVSPLNGARKVSLMEPNDGGAPRSYEYYIKVVPTLWEKLNGEVYESYQYVSNSNHIVGRFQMPAIYFRYDFSPITVKFRQHKSTFAHFLVQVCAIVGGVFTVLGLVNGIALAAGKRFKGNINKLG